MDTLTTEVKKELKVEEKKKEINPFSGKSFLSGLSNAANTLSVS